MIIIIIIISHDDDTTTTTTNNNNNNMTRKQSFKCSRSSMIFLHSPSNAVTKCLLLLFVIAETYWKPLNMSFIFVQ